MRGACSPRIPVGCAPRSQTHFYCNQRLSVSPLVGEVLPTCQTSFVISSGDRRRGRPPSGRKRNTQTSMRQVRIRLHTRGRKCNMLCEFLIGPRPPQEGPLSVDLRECFFQMSGTRLVSTQPLCTIIFFSQRGHCSRRLCTYLSPCSSCANFALATDRQTVYTCTYCASTPSLCVASMR